MKTDPALMAGFFYARLLAPLGRLKTVNYAAGGGAGVV